MKSCDICEKESGGAWVCGECTAAPAKVEKYKKALMDCRNLMQNLESELDYGHCNCVPSQKCAYHASKVLPGLVAEILSTLEEVLKEQG